jgi:uncharacterized protein DUF1800
MPRKALITTILFGVVLSTFPLWSKISEDEKIAHALDRLTYGARPGDLEAVRKMGLKQWMELQLHPERIAENPVLAEKLKPLETLEMSAAEMAAAYPPRTAVRNLAKLNGVVSGDELRSLRDRTPEERRSALKAMRPQAVIAGDLAEGKLFRAIYSGRQLAEVLADF